MTRAPALPAAPSDALASFTVYVATVSEPNARGHWALRAKRAKVQRKAAWATVKPMPLPCSVLLTRIALRELDDDNLRPALKAIRDGVADRLGIDDRDPRVTWLYDQQKCHGYAVRIDFLPFREPPRMNAMTAATWSPPMSETPKPRRKVAQPVRHMAETGVRSLFALDPGDLLTAAVIIHDRVLAIYRANRPHGGYVFVTHGHAVYVLPEFHPMIPTWMREQSAWLVGYYSPAQRRDFPDAPPFTVRRLQEDLIEHLVDLRT